MPPGSSIENMSMQLLFLNFVSVHTTSWTINHVLLDLAAYPEHQDPLKEEIEFVLRRFGGWKKQALTQMKKLDSVLHESQRINAMLTSMSIHILTVMILPYNGHNLTHSTATIIRKAKVPCRLSDGTFMPKGTWVMSSVNAVHHSETNYEDPMKFDGFR
jgi:cytochrome P450